MWTSNKLQGIVDQIPWSHFIKRHNPMKFIVTLSSLALISISNIAPCLAVNQAISHTIDKSLQSQFLLNTARMMQINTHGEKLYKTVQIVAQSGYQDNVWSFIKMYVPNTGDKKSLLCVFSKARNLTPYNILLGELYRESFGDGVAETVREFLKKNSHDFTYQFHMEAMNNGAVRINALDTRDNYINHNYIVDFYPNEKFDFINYGKQPHNAQGEEKILEIYRTYLPFVLRKRCIQSFQYLEG